MHHELFRTLDSPDKLQLRLDEVFDLHFVMVLLLLVGDLEQLEQVNDEITEKMDH